jgi:hypothetical protein
MVFPHDFSQPITKDVVQEIENFITSRGKPTLSPIVAAQVCMTSKSVTPHRTITLLVTDTPSVIAQKGASDPTASVGSSWGNVSLFRSTMFYHLC